MEIRVLRYFLETAREGNITRAAERLHVTQPTMSRQLKDLEEELGKTLPGYHEVAIGNDGKAVHATGEGVTLLPNKLPEGADPVTTDFFNYYKGRAFHPRAINSNGIWSSTTPYGFFDFDLMAHVEELSPRPLLLITGDKAHSRYHSENVYERAQEPKELIVMPGATHCDLYDIYEKIPFERLDGFFTKHLGK